MKMHRTVGLLLALVLASPVLGQAPPATAPGALLTWSKTNLAAVDAGFKRGTDADLNAMLPIAQQWCGQLHVPSELWKEWAPALMAKQRISDVADLTLRGILGRPDVKAYPYLLPMRIQTLLTLNQPVQALQAAKSFYNVTDARRLPNARGLVQLALQKAHPDDPKVATTFLAQQAAATPPGDAGVLHGVTIDGSTYEGGLGIWKARADKGSVPDLLSYGCLLLIADKGAEGEAVFRKALPLCDKEADTAACMEGIAAALRTQDENNTRAAQYLATAPVPATAPKADKSDPLP